MGYNVAQPGEYEAIREFYHSLIDAMTDAEYKPEWEKDVYPSQELLLKSIQKNELFYWGTETEIKACMIVNHNYNEGYRSVKWSVDAADEELLVIHALGVHPRFAGQGLAKEMVQAVFNMAKSRDVKTIRLDVLEGNIPAEQVYVKMGFQYVSTEKMFYEDTGWTGFKMYEYIC